MRKRESYLMIATYVIGGLIVAGIGYWLFVTPTSEQAFEAARKAERDQKDREYYGVPASLYGLKFGRPRTGTRLEKPLPAGKLLVVFDSQAGGSLVNGYQEVILGSSIGLSPYHASLLPNRRADVREDVSGVVWLGLHHETDRVDIVDQFGVLIRTADSESLLIDAVVTDLEGNVLSDTIQETLHLVDGIPQSSETRKEAKIGAVPEGIVHLLRDKLGINAWQASLPALDVDRHKEWVRAPAREDQRASVP